MQTDSVAAERGKVFFKKFVVPFIEFLCALGSASIAYLGGVAHARALVLGAGISPTSNLTTNLPQSTVTSFDKVFIENLKGETPWVRCCSRRTLDENSGNKLVLYMYQNLPAPASPPVQSPEGTIGTGLTVSVVQNTSTIGNYADYANISTFALQTAIDPALEALGVQMAYRFAQVINLILQLTADGANAIDALVGHLSKVGSAVVTTVDITAAAQSLQGVNALPFENGNYTGVVHPFTVGDFMTDKTNNSLVDVVKRTAEGSERLKELPAPDGDNVTVLEWGGVRFHQSTLVKQTANYSGTTQTGLRTYVVGKDGLIGISFGAKENTQVGDGDWRNIQVWVRRLTEPSGFDPSRMIGGFASYNGMYTATLPPDPVQRIRYIDAVSAIS
jgi:N4-gp56 family major capsid protein